MNGCTLGNFGIFRKLDYVIEVDAPFSTRNKRVNLRNNGYIEKNKMVALDVEFNKSKKRGIKYKGINKKIINTGSLEDLQRDADKIYDRVIAKSNREPSMKEKYGGYKIKSPRIISKKKSRIDRIK